MKDNLRESLEKTNAILEQLIIDEGIVRLQDFASIVELFRVNKKALIESKPINPVHPERFEPGQPVIDIADLRNKLQPIVSFIDMMERGHTEIANEALPIVKESINYLADKEVFRANAPEK